MTSDLETQTQTGPALAVRGLKAGYDSRPVVFGVDLEVPANRLTALIGANGAGKTTTLRTIAGLLPAYGGEVSVWGDQAPVRDSVRRIQQGVVYLPQEKAVFGDLSVRDNLLLGAVRTKNAAERRTRYDMCLSLFPRLAERLTQRAGTMSGGEQRMLAVSITLMAGARLLLLDEPSVGLAPRVVQDMMTVFDELVREAGLTILLVEQDIRVAIARASTVYVMRSGQIVWSGDHAAAAARSDWSELF
jgi:branched-chain amino acid transport system ATP-binding protein